MFVLFCFSPEFLPVCTGIVGHAKRTKKGPPGPIYSPPPGSSYISGCTTVVNNSGTLFNTSENTFSNFISNPTHCLSAEALKSGPRKNMR
jgi:hypothetical protein